MYFNRKNAEQKNWRMIKKGKHFLFGCSLVFAVGAALVAPSVKADAVDAKPEASSTTEGIKPVAAEENATYAAPAVEVAPSTPVAPATVVAEEKAVVVENTTAKTANKEALTQLVEEVKVLDKAGKTEDSLARLNTALDQAQKVLDNAEASQEQVDAALASLKDAVAQLAAKEEKAATVATEEKTEVKEAEAAVAETEVARPRGKRAANRSIDGSLGTGEFTGEGVKQFESVRYSVDGDKTTWTIEVVPEKASNTFAGLAVTSDDTISSIRMIGKSGKFGNNLKDQYLDLPKRPDNMPFANYKVHMSEFRTIGGGIPDNIVYEVVTNGKNHNLFGRFATALVESSLKNNGLNGKSVIGARTSDFPTVGVSLKSKLPAETPKPQPQPETPKPVTPTTQAPEITSNLSGKASTPADVTVKAPAGSTVKLYNKDGVVIGEAVANDQGVATVHPTNSLPEGEITATSTPAGGSESAKSAPITVTKSPITESGLNRNGDAYTQLLLSKTHITVYPGDNVDIDVIGAASSYIKRFYPVNPNSVYGLFPDGIYFQTTGSQQHRQLNNKYHGTVHEKQPAGDFVTTFVLESKNGKVVSTPLKITVLESAKKYEPVAGAKVEVADVNNVSEAEKTKIIAAAKAANTALPSSATYSVDEKGNLVITYADKSTDKIAAAYLVTPAADTEAPAKPVVNTDLTGKAGTKTPVEVAAEKGSTVALYDKDGNKIGEATAGENGKATITPSVNIPAGAVTAKATDAAGNTSVASDPTTATPAADTEAPAKPVVNTDLTGKAGTKTPVEVTAEKGSTVALYDKDNNKIGEATAGENGKATITPTVDIPAGAVTAKATDAAGNTSVASDPATATAPAATVVAPTVEIPYSNKDTKEVYVYAGEENSFDIKFKDDSGKIVSATVKQGGNREFGSVAGEENTINTQYGFKANVISSETPATADAPAVITYRGTPAATDGLKPEVLEAATKGENPAGMVLGWRYATATDADGAFIENKAVGSSNATDPGSFRVMLKAQSQKYDIVTPTEKVTVADPSKVTDDDLAKIKEKLQLEYSKTNDDANLADQKGKAVDDKDGKIQSVTKDADGNLVVTYKDGSQDKKPLSEFVTKAPTVELPYSNQEHKQIYVYTGENTDLTFKAADDTAVKDMYVRGPGGIGEDNTARYGFTTGKIENSAVTHGDGTVSGATATIKMTGVTTLKAPNRWTSFVVANDNDNAPSNTDFNALDKNPNATQTPGYVQFIVKSQTDKYDIATPAPADKVEVADPTNVTNDDLDKIKEKLQLEYNKKNDDANISKDSPVDKNGKIQSVTKDNQGNLVVTYTDGSKDTKPLTEFVTKKPTTPDTEAPAKPVVDTDLTGKAGTKTPVEVSAEPGSKVELFDKDGNKIGEGTADKNGKATVTPTVNIPEGNVTAKATDPSGNVSVPSDPAKATTPSTPDTEAPAKPVVDTDLTGKAGTKTPVVVSAEPGSKVELFDKDGNKIGEGTADKNGKATITPTVNIPEGNVTAKATDPSGNVSVPSEPAKATTGADTEAPAKPVVNTDLTGKAGTKTPVEVSAEPGSKVELFDKDGNKIGEGTADKNGKATITPTVAIPEGNVTAKATDPSGNVSVPSEPAKATTPSTPDTEAPAKPEVKTDLTGKAGTKTPVEVNAEPGSKVELFDKDGNKIGEATAGTDGKATITPTVNIPEGNVTAKATDPSGNVSVPSEPAKATTPSTPDTEAPAKPEVKTDLTGKAGTKTPVEVNAEPGSKVELFDKDGNKIGEATAGTDGKATITPTVAIPEGNVTAKATDPSGNVSVPSEPAKATTPSTPDTEAPAKPVVNTDLTGKAGTKTPVEVSAEPGSTVALYDKDGNKIGEATAGENGKATITPTVNIPEGNVTAKATDPSGNTSVASDPAKATTPSTPDTEAPAKPVVDTDLTGKAGTKTPVVVNAEPGSKVELFDKDGNKIGEGTADKNGKATITPTVEIPEGNVTAKATDPSGNVSVPSDPAKATTGADTEAPAKPVVDTDLTGKAGTKTPVEVSAEPGSKVELFDKDGNKIGEGTADKNGKATITPTVNIPEGNVTAKATDPSGNVSVPSDPAKATTPSTPDTEAPAKPVVDTDLTGKAGTKTPVVVSAEPGSKVELFDKDGNKIGEATAGTDGKATITPTVAIPEGNVTAKATDPSGNVSEPSEPAKATTPSTPDTEAPAKPEVKTDLTGKAGTKTPVEVNAEPGSKVELFDKDGNKIGEATAGTDGKATITPTVAIPEGNVTAKATDPSGNVSEPSEPAKATTPSTPDTEAPAKPEVKTDLTGKAGTKTPVEVNAEPGSKVELFDKDGNKIGEATAGTDGKATITPTVAIPEGNVTAKATDPSGNVSVPSEPAKATTPSTPDTEAPAKPEVKTDLTGKAGTKTPVEVNAEPGSKVELFDKDGNKIGEATAGTDGKATITPTVAIPEGNVTAKATDPSGNVSEPSEPAKATTPSTPDTEAPAKPEVKTDLTGKAGTKTPVEVNAEPGSKVELFDKDGNKIGEATAGTDGKATITPTVAIPEGNVTAKATDPSGNVSEPSEPAKATTPSTPDTEAPAKPEVKTDLTGKAGTKTPVEVNAEPGSKVELFDKDGNKIGEATAGTDGKATITPTVAIPEGNVTAKATDPSGNVSEPSEPAKATTPSTPDTEAPAKPEVKTDLTGKAGTKTPVEVNAEPGSKVELFDKDGNKIGEATAGTDGKATITPTVAIPEGNVTAKATDPSGNVSEPSEPAKATTPSTPDTEAPAKPEVKTDLTGKAGTKTPVEVNAEPGSKVELFDKDGNKIGEATAGTDGKATITPTVAIPEGNVTAKATDAAGNTSDASEPAKATPVKTPAVTPVANPSALTDAEKAKVADEVKKANPTASKVEVGNDGTATVTFPDGSKATLTPEKTVKEADSNGVKTPSVTPVVNPSALTDAEKAKVADEVKKANPTASKVEVGNDGTATVTFPDGSKASLTPAQTVKEADKELKDPAVTPVTDPSNLTDAEKAKVAEEVKKANPTVTDVKVGEDGTTTVTYPGGTTAVIPAEKTVKKSADKELNDPAVTPVTDPSDLTDAEKTKVADEVKKANPSVTDVTVGNDGAATVTYPDGTTAVIPAEKTVKKSDDKDVKDVKDPAITPVADPSNLTDAEKTKVADEVKKANPSVTDVTVGNDGTATVTYPDGKTAVIPAEKTVKKSDDKVIKDPAVTPVVNPSALTDAEKAKVADEVKKANPSVTDVTVGNDGTATVTYPDGTTAVIPAEKTVKKSDDKVIKVPAVTPVVNPSALTDAEKAKVADEVKKANPTASKVEVGNDGTATVTFPDGSTAVLTPAQTVKEADSNGVKTPAVTPVVNPSALTDAEKAKVADEVKKANPTATDVKVGEDGTATVTFPDGSKATLTPAQTVKEADSNGVKTPAVTPVVNPSALTDAEKAKVADEVKKANPTATDVKVGEDGTATVTFPDGSTASLTPAQTVKEADSNGVKTPAVTPVVNPSALTDAEKAKVADEVKKANPTATDVKVGEDGTATVTFPDGSKASLTPAQTVKEADSNGVKTPAVTPVVNPSALTDAEKAKVADEVKKANPTATDVKVGEDGTATVTFPDGSKATLTPAQTVKEADSNGVKTPAVTPVANPSSLTDAEKAKVADEVKKSNPTATDVKVGEDGTTTVTFPDGSKATLTPAQTVKEADKELKDPAVTPVTDPSNLTDAEKAKVADEVKKANPTVTDVKVGEDGTTTVTYPGGTTAVLPSNKTVKRSVDKELKDPAVTPVTNPSNLTDAEKAKVADEVKKANPTVTDVKVGEDGTTTVTYSDGTTATLTPEKTVKEADSTGVNSPAVTPVVNPSALTDAEKAKVADEVKKANPTVTDVKVDEDGTTTVTFPDGTTAVISPDKTVKKSADKVIKDPAVTPVVNPSALTDAEKAKVAEEVKKANPTVTDVKVGEDGTATVTYPDGTTAVIPSDKTVKKSDDKVIKIPAVTPVANPSALTDAEKAKVADEVKKANPTASKVEVGNDGTATVTFPDGSTASLTPAQTVKEADSNGVKTPAVTPVVNPSALTDAEKAKVADEVKKANPTASKVEVGNDGTATVTFPDGSKATLTPEKTVKEADSNGVKTPSVTPVANPSALTDAEKAKVADEVKKANPTASKVEVGNDGTATVTFPDGSKATLTPEKTVKEADSNGVKTPSVTPVVNPSSLTDAEKAKVADEVKKANPTASKVEVGNDGTATVTFPDGSKASLTPAQTVKEADKELKDPAVTPVTDPSNLTDAEKAKVAEEVKKANPTVTDVKVGEDGTTTVTYPGGTTAVIPAEKTVKKSADKELNDPAVTPVTDPSDLTDAEKTKVADEVKKANPTASKVEVGNDGSATVTFPDGSTAVLTPEKTVKEADSNGVKTPAVTPVVNPSALTDAEKAKVADEVKKANPTASKVEVGNDGSATVTFPDGSTAVIPADKTVKKSSDKAKESDGVKNPSVTPVTDPSNLTDTEKAKVAEEVKKANPTAKDIKVNNDGSVVVTFADGSVAVLASENVVKEATKESSAQAPAKKAGAKELPNTGTKQSNASLGLALLAAVTGGLLIAKKREEEE